MQSPYMNYVLWAVFGLVVLVWLVRWMVIRRRRAVVLQQEHRAQLAARKASTLAYYFGTCRHGECTADPVALAETVISILGSIKKEPFDPCYEIDELMTIAQQRLVDESGLPPALEPNSPEFAAMSSRIGQVCHHL